MADFLNLQQPPTKKFRSGTNSNESGIRKKKVQCSSFFFVLDFDFKMISQYDTPDTNNTQDLFDIGNDFNDTLDNTQQQTSTSTTSIQSTVPSSSSPILNQQSTNIYQQQQQTQPRLTYVPQTRAQLSSYQTPNLQRIQTMPPTPTIVRPANVISNGIQQQPTIYTQQQMINSSGGLNRPLYQRMPTATQQSNMPSTLVRQQYNTTGMINMNQNVPQMSIVKVRKFHLHHIVKPKTSSLLFRQVIQIIIMYLLQILNNNNSRHYSVYNKQ